MKKLTDLEVALKLEEIEREEPKQETIEEAAENYLNSGKIPNDYRSFIEGAKWQKEKSHSGEEVKFIERLIGFYWVENNSEHPNNLEEWELSQKILEQFKKK